MYTHRQCYEIQEHTLEARQTQPPGQVSRGEGAAPIRPPTHAGNLSLTYLPLFYLCIYYIYLIPSSINDGLLNCALLGF